MKTYGEMTAAEIRAEMGTPEEMAAVIARARWVPSGYIEGALTMAGDADTDDGCYSVDAAGGMVYRNYAGGGYETGVSVTLGPPPDDGMYPGEPIAAVTASVAIDGEDY